MDKILKMLVDFYDQRTTGDGLLELYFESHNYKKGDTITADLCMFKQDHTYIRGKVLRTYKHKVVMTKEYL